MSAASKDDKSDEVYCVEKIARTFYYSPIVCKGRSFTLPLPTKGFKMDYIDLHFDIPGVRRREIDCKYMQIKIDGKDSSPIHIDFEEGTRKEYKMDKTIGGAQWTFTLPDVEALRIPKIEIHHLRVKIQYEVPYNPEKSE